MMKNDVRHYYDDAAADMFLTQYNCMMLSY
jgi:hypothetical protein